MHPASSLSLFVLAHALVACPIEQAGPPPGENERRSLTTNLVDEIVLPRLADFAAKTATLQTTSATWAATGQGKPEAQQAWREAMAVWQGLEVLHVGPAASPSTFAGGQGLRDRIYGWPQLNLCALDQQLFANEFGEAGWVDARLPNVIGLAALEYVLFVDNDNNLCPATAPINADGSWAALGATEIQARRARLAAVVAADVAVRAAALHDVWTASFAATLRTAGEKGSLFPTAQQALDEVYAGLFAVELVTKDKKLGIPAGLHVECATTTCPEKLESRFSLTSKENVIVNLDTTRRVLLGLDRADRDVVGFDDLLRDRGAADLADTLIANLDAAIAAGRAFDGSFEDALAVEPTRVQAVYDAVKLFTDDFKSTLPSTLGLRVPDEGAGDND